MGASGRRILSAALVLTAVVLSIARLSTSTPRTYAALALTHEPRWGVELEGPIMDLKSKPEESMAPTVAHLIEPLAVDPTTEKVAPFVPDATQAALEVQVLDEQGVPLVGAHVACFPFESDAPRRTHRLIEASKGNLALAPRTDQEGRCLLVLPPMDRARVTVISANSGRVLHSQEVRSLLAGSKRQLQLSGRHNLPQPWYLKLTTDPGQLPPREPWIQSFELETMGQELLLGDPSPLSPMGGGVWATLLDLAQSQVVIVGAEGLAPRAVMMRPGHSRWDHPMQINLQRGGRLRIQTTAKSELTLKVPLCALGDNVPKVPILWHLSSDENGWIQADQLPTGVTMDVVWNPIVAAAPRQIEFSEATPLVLDLAPLPGSTRLSGSLRDPGGRLLAHIPLVLISATRKGSVHLPPETRPLRRLISDQDGHFVLDNLPAAAWWICPEPGHGWAPVTRWFEVPSNAQEIRLELQALPARAIAGQVVDDAGTIVAGATVRLTDEGGKVLAEQISGLSGGFAFEAPTGEKLYVQSLACGAHGSSTLMLCPLSAQPMKLKVHLGGQIHGIFLTPKNGLSQGPHQVLLHSPDQAPRRFTIESAFFRLEGLKEGCHALAVLDTAGRVGTLVVNIDGESTPPATIHMGLGQTTEIYNPTSQPMAYKLTAEGAVWMKGTLAPEASRTVAIPASPVKLYFGPPKSELPQLQSFPDHAPDRILLETST